MRNRANFAKVETHVREWMVGAAALVAAIGTVLAVNAAQTQINDERTARQEREDRTRLEDRREQAADSSLL